MGMLIQCLPAKATADIKRAYRTAKFDPKVAAKLLGTGERNLHRWCAQLGIHEWVVQQRYKRDRIAKGYKTWDLKGSEDGSVPAGEPSKSDAER